MSVAATLEGNGALGAGGRGGGVLNKGFLQFDGAASFILNEVSELGGAGGVVEEEGHGERTNPHPKRSGVDFSQTTNRYPSRCTYAYICRSLPCLLSFFAISFPFAPCSDPSPLFSNPLPRDVSARFVAVCSIIDPFGNTKHLHLDRPFFPPSPFFFIFSFSVLDAHKRIERTVVK